MKLRKTVAGVYLGILVFTPAVVAKWLACPAQEPVFDMVLFESLAMATAILALMAGFFWSLDVLVNK